MTDKTELAIVAINALEPILIASASLVANIVVLWQLFKAKSQRAEATAEVAQVKSDVAEVKAVATETKAAMNHKIEQDAKILELAVSNAASTARLSEKQDEHARQADAALMAAEVK